MKHIFFYCTGPCPSGWTLGPSKHKCFEYIAHSQSWANADSQCQDYHGHLAAVTSFEELTIVQKLCGDFMSGCWIGGRHTNGTSDVGWTWSDNTSDWNGTIIPKIPLKFNCKNKSCQSEEKFSCSLTLGTNGSTSVMAEPCNMSHAYICMTYIGKQLFFTW